MSNINTNSLEPTKLQIDETFFLLIPTCSRHVFLILDNLSAPLQYIFDMLRDLADAIMTSYPEVKEKILFYSYL